MNTNKIKFVVMLIALFTFVSLSTSVSAQVQETKQTNHGPRFVDANGDGICDNMIDTNNDGIPDTRNGKGTGPKDGTGKKHGYGNGNGTGTGLHQNGTGVCDGTGPKGKRGGK